MKKIIKKMSGGGVLLNKVLSIVLILTILIIPFSTVLNTKAEGFNFILSDTITKSDDVNSKLITNNATITVTNFEYISQTNDGYIAARKIINAFYNQNTNEVSYEFTEAFQTFLNSNETYKTLTIADYFALTSDNPDGSASTSVITTSTLNKLLSEYLSSGSVLSDYNFKGVSTGEACNGIDCPGTASGTVATGVYALSGYRTLNMYGVMTANVVPTVDANGNWTINNPTIVAKKSNIANLGTITILSQSLDLEQTILRGTANYKLNIPDMPTNMTAATNYQFLLLSGNINSISVINENSTTTDLTINEDGTIYMGDIQVATKISDTNGNGDIVEITDLRLLDKKVLSVNYTYSITDENIIFGGNGNPIRVVTSWQDDPYSVGITSYNYIDEISYVYAIGIMTQESGSESTFLNGAEYELYKTYDPETNTLSDKVDSEVVNVENVSMTAVFEEGIYYAKQIKAPSGYKLSKDIIKIDVSMNSENQTEDDGIYMATCYNEKSLFSLPSTGGMGIIVYTIVGLFIVVFGAFMIIRYSKKQIQNS